MKQPSPVPRAARKRHYTPEQRTRLLEELARSGLTVPEFASRHGLCAQTVHGWRHRQRHLPTQAASLVPDGPAVFAEVPLPELFRPNGAWAGELQLPNGSQLRWNPQASLTVLHSLLAHLRRPC
jgi:hypothetical protein